MSNVLFRRGRSQDFVNLPKDPNTIYFVEDTHKIYLGADVYSFQGISIVGSGDFVSGVDYSVSDKILTIHKSDAGSSDSVRDAIDTALKSAVKSISTDRGSAIIVDDSDPEHVKLDLKIAEGSDAGNVVLEQCSEGLKASVDIPDVPVQGVRQGDKIASIIDSQISTQLSLEYDNSGSAPFLVLKGIDGVVISRIDVSDFIADGMIELVEYNPETHILHIRFNVAAGQDNRDVYINLSDLIDVYDADPDGGLQLVANKFSIKNSVIPGTTQRDPARPGFGDTFSIKTISYDKHGLITEPGSFTVTLPVLSGDVGGDGTLIKYVGINNSGQLQGESVDIVSEIVDDDALIPTSKAVNDFVDAAMDTAVQDAMPIWETY